MPERQAGPDRTTPFERFFETAAEMLCILGVDGRIHHANPAWQRVLGWSREAVCGRSLSAFVHPDDVAATHATLAALARSEPVDRFANRCRHSRGGWRWLEWRPVLGPDDGLIYGSARDVTDARRETLRHAEILRGIGAGTWEWHVPSGEYRINEQWAALLGFARTELEPITAATWETLCHPGDMPAVAAALDRHFAGETAEYQQELRMRRRDGRWTWVLDTGRVVSWQSDGTPEWMIGAIIDIDAQKAGAAALARRDAMLCAVAASAGRLLNGGDWKRETNRLLAALGLAAEADRAYVFLTCDGAEPCTRVDQIAEWCAPGVSPEIDNPALQGFDMAHAGLGRWIATFLEGNPIIAHRAEDMTPCERAILEPQGITALCVQPLISDGRLEGFVGFDICGRPVAWSQPVLDALSAGAHLIGAGLAMARTHADLVAARQRAEAASHTKSLFLANMSHEIRTPMNGVLGMAAVLDAALTDPAHRRMLGVIRESGQLLLGLLNDILDLSKIEAGRLTLECEPFVPADVAPKIEALHRPRAVEKGLILTVRTGPDAARPRTGDAQRVMQVLHNLVGNALKFTERGTVTVTIGEALGGTAEGDGALLLTVQDTGIGMSPDELARVFDDFVQADASTTRRFGGTGLGMSIVRRLVAAMDGRIAVESEPGKGTDVRVSLPLPRARLAPERAGSAAPPRMAMAAVAPLGLHVLAAEYNAINRLVLEAMLARLGAQVTMVEDGRAALAAWAPGRFDALLLDISMPVMDGVAALAAIRAAETAAGCRAAPAIAVTAHALTHEVEHYLASGFDYHVAKPIEPESLERTLRALAGHGLHELAAGS